MVSVLQQRIKERKIAGESETMSDEYLKNVDYFYKQQYLKEISASSELLVYDWSNGGETEIIVEDIERIGN